MNLCHLPTLKGLLNRHGLQPTKALGQHFLVSESVVRAIVEAIPAGVQSVVEVGPGPGVLTRPLSERFDQVLAFELDPVAVSALGESAPGATVRHEDVLRVDLEREFDSLPKPRALVSNMPYNITGPLLGRFTQARLHCEIAVLMMQREVAERILAQPGDSAFGSASLLIQARFEVSLVTQVPAGAFYPPPKVQSTVLALRPKRLDWDPVFDAAHERFARAGFTQPRKTLANNLKGLHLERESVELALRGLGIAPTIRPHQVGLTEWEALARWWHDQR